LKLKKKASSADDISAIQQQLFDYLQSGNPSVKGLLDSITLISKDKIWEVLKMPQDQGKITIDDAGMITKR